LNDPKEVYEHQVVVSGIVERLRPFGAVAVGETGEIRLPTLIHLHTRIRVPSCNHFEFSDWVTALHPTPAIGAWPLEAGWRWLRSQSNAQSRKRYGAPFGLIPPGQTTGRCLVAIRNLQWDSERAWITAGGGIVAASVLEREWSEFNSKLDSVQEALGI
jgi:menaquinone-specific isochorismate synthase